MPAKYGYGGFIGLGKQTSYGTKVSVSDFLPFIDAEISDSHGEIWSEASWSRYDRTPQLGKYDVRMSGTVEVRPDDAGLLFLGLFSDLTSEQQGATSAYKHTFQPQLSLTYLTAQLKYGTANVAEEIDSLALTEFSLEWAFEILTASFEGLGKKSAKVTPASATFSNLNPFLFHQATVTLGGSQVGVRSGRVSFTNAVDEDDYESGSRYRAGAEPGKLAGEVELELYFTDLSMVQKFWGSASATEPQDTPATYACNIKFEGTVIEDPYKYTVEVDIPKLFLTAVDRPISGQDKIIQRVHGRVVVDDESADLPSLILINTETSY